MIRGIVQGVGFRPYVYQLARKHQLTGNVRNVGAQVTIEVQGEEEEIKHFCLEIQIEKPAAATMIEMKVKWLSAKREEKEFVILSSKDTRSPVNYISPDLGICQKCRREVRDGSNRRYQFPFINCTDCGPRFSIIKRLPYDRRETTMDSFTMCATCKAEYETPTNRRFHAEPSCCHQCGPKLWICDREGMHMPFSMSFIREQLMKGSIIALKGIGGFHLLCNAYEEKTVALLRKRKNRDQKPLALMAKNLEVIKKYCNVSSYEVGILESTVKPIVVLNKKRNMFEYLSDTNTLGMMLPYTALHVMLFEESLELLVATSGNLANEPICYENEEALYKLGNIADYFVMHDREILRPIDDSIIRVKAEQAYVMRRARGLVPKIMDFSFIHKGDDTRSILSVGAEQKDTFCITKGSYAIMSQHIGNLNSYETMFSFRKLIEQFQTLYDCKPEKIVGDNHPDYVSSHMVREGVLEKKSVQHHHAHIAACMAENKITQKVIGIALDGTGYGDDKAIWGGEFFLCDLKSYQRIAHFEYIPMPGGEQCIQEPWRMANAYLHHYGLFEPQNKKEEFLLVQLQSGINCPMTSSVGRLFDAVSALLGVCKVSKYEAQPANLLEMYCEQGEEEDEEYPYTIREGRPIIISCELLFRGILDDLQKHVSIPRMAMKFHRMLVRIIVDVCAKARKQTGIEEVAFGGGVFQNLCLARLAEQELIKAGFHVFRNNEIPVNDGGISFGQAAIGYEEERNVSISSGKD